jgi:NAD(P)-dependent dehydrogenase (short-subunit alcohol dehydrogenase family)
MMPTALIVGSSRGLGLEFVRQYHRAGWRVLAACRDPATASVLNELASRGPGIEVVACDVTDGTSVTSLARGMADRSIDHLILNAGIPGPRDYTTANFDEQAWIEVMRTNTIAPLRFAGSFVDHVQRSEKKLMAFISSRLGSMAENSSGGHYIYGSSKAALNRVVKSLAIELKPRGITCIVLTPGWVKTDMGGDQAPLTAETSVKGMLEVLNRVTLEDAGHFYQYDGREIPW